MEMEDRLVDIPAYAKVNKNGNYYAMKRDMPYFQDERDVRGYLVIGRPSDIPGKMIAELWYDWYCTPDAFEKKQESEKKRKEEEKRKQLEEEERLQELKQTMGEEYIPVEKIWDDQNCYPLNGYLAEKFFRESGLSSILDDVFGKEKAFLVKLSAALIGTIRPGLIYGGLHCYPMELHMRYDMDRFLNTDLWKSITEDEFKQVLERWIEKVQPQKVSSLAMDTKITLYHDSTSDSYADGWFFSRIRAGTKYSHAIQVYRDEFSGKLLAVENLKYDPDYSWSMDKVTEIYTIQHSDYPELRNASLHFFLPAYLFLANRAVKQIPLCVWMHPSEFEDQKEMKKKLLELEKQEPNHGFRIIRWQGEMEGVSGNWSLVEHTERRQWQEKDARNLLNSHKKRLQQMSYYPACDDYMAHYYQIEKDDDEADIFDSAPFTVNFIPKATEIFKRDAGRYLHFTTEGELSDRQLLKNLWCEEDLIFQYSSFINQGQTSDIAEDYMEAMGGRELPLFLASLYREWIYDHIGDLFTDEYDVNPFASEIASWCCNIKSDGSVQPEKMNEHIRFLLDRFAATEEDVVAYLSKVINQSHYFSDAFAG